MDEKDAMEVGYTLEEFVAKVNAIAPAANFTVKHVAQYWARGYQPSTVRRILEGTTL